jgi:hypothetical protein
MSKTSQEESSIQLTLLPEGFHVKTYPSLESVGDWLEIGRDCGLSSIELSQKFAQDGLLSKTSVGFSTPITGETLQSCWEGLPESYQKFLRGAGGMREQPRDPSTKWYIALSIHNFLEYPKDGEESLLSDVLEIAVPPKYYLSKRAANGILRRAKEGGKELPPMLADALKQVVMGGEFKDN